MNLQREERKRILLVDDEEDFCFFVKNNLEAVGGFEVAVCTDGSEIIPRIKEFQPHLILLDLKMPKKDGSVIACELKNDRDTRVIPFAFLTALVSQEETQEKGNFIGGEYFIAKPAKISEIVGIIHKLLDKAKES